MIKESKWKQFGRQGLEVKGITIHNTSNYEKSAIDLKKWLEEECKTSQGCHYLIDHSKVVEVMPLDWCIWHTGKAFDYGNMHTIAIEICSNHDKEKYLQAEKKAVELIKKLMKKYHLSTSDIFFHNDFTGVNCPANILQEYGTKNNFINQYFGGQENE